MRTGRRPAPPLAARTGRAAPWRGIARAAWVLWLLAAPRAHPLARGFEAVSADPAAYGLCRAATAQAERATGVPDQLLTAISRVESGRPDPDTGRTEAWPWSIDVGGVGHVYATREEAIEAVRSYQAAGARSIDVGCMQINLAQHPGAFASLEAAFDPATNAAYAATFLRELFAQTGSWPHAAAAYHSQTPDLGRDYQAQVLARWAEGDPPDGTTRTARRRDASVEAARAPSAAFAARNASGSLFASSGTEPGAAATGVARAAVSPFGASPAGPAGAIGSVPRVRTVSYGPAATGPGGTGRGLSAYRAMPIALAGRPLFPSRF